MSGVTLRQLRYFCAVARTGNFGRAADQVAISQPALSQQVRELETQLGGTLLDRSGRAVTLTALGREIASRGEDILRAVEDLQTAARAAASGVRVRLGIIPTIAPYLLPALMTALSRPESAIRLTPYEAQTGRLLDVLREGRIDAALVALPVDQPGLHEESLFHEDFVLVRHPDEAGQPAPPATSLAEAGLLLLDEGHCFRDQALSYCNMTAQQAGGIEGSSLGTLVQMVAAGVGVTLVPRMAVGLESRAARVDMAELRPPRPQREVGLVWRKGSPLDPHLKTVAAAAIQAWRAVTR